ncbi:Protein fluG [Psilocybe cubensis]|nr:Protein fluG [Psilocybe cubensis]KAH9477060.1 Protein fluG [Psilocybe cubensis]
MDTRKQEYPELYKAAFTQPAIDNHAHPLLRVDARYKVPFEGLVSEADGDALVEDAPNTLACMRATKQLAELYGLDKSLDWEQIKEHRDRLDYSDLCNLCFKNAGIHTILIDDGLGGVAEMAEGYAWHDQFTTAPTKRIVRVEIVAEGILRTLFAAGKESDLEGFEKTLQESLKTSAEQQDVVGFKSIVCYRTGMNVSVYGSDSEKREALAQVYATYKESGKIRLQHKPLNDQVVRIALTVAGRYKLPVQFHTGLGDSDITLTLSSPAHLQPIIKQFPDTPFVLLHSSYPYTRDAGYLAAVYRNVYLDFGEVFPFVSGDGQRSIIRQVLELAPTNKIMWSSDGHWWPESYYLGIYQARQAIFEVLSDLVERGEITEAQGVQIIEMSLFKNAKQLYQLA